MFHVRSPTLATIKTLGLWSMTAEIEKMKQICLEKGVLLNVETDLFLSKDKWNKNAHIEITEH